MSTDFDQQAFIQQLRLQGAEVRLSKTGNVLVVDFRTAPSEQIAVDLKPLIHFDRLRELYVPKCCVDDNLLEEFGGLEKLQTLDLRQTQVTEAGINSLSRLANLKLLLLSANHVSESYLQAFRRQMIGTRIVVE